jgi:Tol biopolymer transport system component
MPLAITHPGHNEGASWSPDGKKIAFNSARPAGGGIWVMDVDVELLKKELQALNK